MDAIFQRIEADIRAKGVSVVPLALPHALALELREEAVIKAQTDFKPAGIGRQDHFEKNNAIRRDTIAWIEGDTPAQSEWLTWTGELQQHLNRTLLLGLFSFESHFAHYRPGAFYKTHVDAFKGQANRVLSVVAYLNSEWPEEAGGELVVYGEADTNIAVAKVQPLIGTVVVFLSEEFPHEVLPATQDRYSIAGWYRLNTSVNGVIDPPR